MKLFSVQKLGEIELKNRIVMAPMTRSRATDNLVNDLMAEYYALRASAGLLITEGTSPSPNGLGYARIPALYNQQHVQGWQKVTKAVHDKQGRIFMQMMHTGRVSHPANMPAGSLILAPSAIQLSGQMWTDQSGMQNYPLAKEMTEAEIDNAIQEHARSAELAMSAGFDGIELHGANGYLIEQFLNPITNKRTDRWGGSNEGRMRFAIEVTKAVAAKIGAGRIGFRVSPYGVFNDTGAFDGIEEFYLKLTRALSDMGLAYIHVVDHSPMGAPAVDEKIKNMIRDVFAGPYILSGGYTSDTAEAELEKGAGDLVAFGRPFIANPDLVEKMKTGAPLNLPNQDTFYTPGPVGYTDY